MLPSIHPAAGRLLSLVSAQVCESTLPEARPGAGRPARGYGVSQNRPQRLPSPGAQCRAWTSMCAGRNRGEGVQLGTPLLRGVGVSSCDLAHTSPGTQGPAAGSRLLLGGWCRGRGRPGPGPSSGAGRGQQREGLARTELWPHPAVTAHSGPAALGGREPPQYGVCETPSKSQNSVPAAVTKALASFYSAAHAS